MSVQTRSGPSARPRPLVPEAWASLADREGGAMEVRGRKVKAVRFPHGVWTITLDVQSDGESTSTRIRTRFTERNPLRMSIRRHNVFTRLATRLGLGDVTVPDPAIDHTFLVRTDGPSIVRSLVLDRTFSRSLQALRTGRLEVVPVRKGIRRVPGAAELRWVSGGTVKQPEVLESALVLVRRALDGLIRLGVARAPHDSA